MVDTDSPNYMEGYNNSYYLEEGLTIKWWHGWGSFVDYTNPDAVNWWHNQLDLVIDIGIDGWKCDGTDPFIYEWGGIALCYEGLITEREYATLYYRDFFYYTQSKNPEALIWARPVDSYGIIYIDFAPHDVMFSGWVGDQQPTFDGMQDALRNMFHSAWRNYLNYGSDTGGYLAGNRTKTLFIRWAQLSTFTPLFENGGNDEHRPWGFDNETVEIYRNFVTIHMDLNPYFLSIGAERFAQNRSVMTPMANDTILTPDSWDFKMGDDILVSTIVEDSMTKNVKFPEGDDWVDWWTNQTYKGGSSKTFTVPLNSFTVFKRKGSIIPMHVSTKYSSHGDESSSDALTLLIHPKDGTEHRNIYEWKSSGRRVAYTFSEESQSFEFISTAHDQPLILLLRGVSVSQDSVLYNRVIEEELREVELNKDGLPFSCSQILAKTKQGWCRGDPSLGEIWIRPGNPTNGALLKIKYITLA